MTSSKHRTLPPLEPGSELLGKYQIDHVLGSGNFATVVKARHLAMGRDVALKLLKPELVAAHPEVQQRFLAEVKIVSRLSNPNTVTIYDFGRMPDGLLYMVLEYVDGSTLDALIDGQRLPMARVAKIVRQVLKSLDEAHAMGIVHRDLKPGNIMVTERHGETDVVKVLDFGVAKLVGEDDEERTATKTRERRSTQFIGTPIYMSPEQVLGQRVTPASDIYSLGLILYEMLTGDPPVDEKLNVAGVAQIHIDEDPIPFKYLDRLPSEWRSVILKATSRYPEQRFQTVREFARALPAEMADGATGEFAKLMTDETSERDAFSGANYVGLETDSDIPLLEEPRRPRSTPTPRMPEEAVASREAQKFSSSSLQLDVGRVERAAMDQKRRKSPRPESRSPQRAMEMKDLGWALAGVLSLVVCWHLCGTFVPAEGNAARPIVGCVVPILGMFLAYFSDTRNVHGGVLDRFVVPLSRSQVLALGVVIVAAALAFPDHAIGAMVDHGDWPRALGLPWLDFWSTPVQALFEITSDLVPW